MLKPHRVVASRVGLYAEEAAAFVRRRRHSRREFLRIEHRDGTGLDLPVEGEDEAELVAISRRLLDRP